MASKDGCPFFLRSEREDGCPQGGSEELLPSLVNGGGQLLPRLRDGSCFSRRGVGALGEVAPAPALRLE